MPNPPDPSLYDNWQEWARAKILYDEQELVDRFRLFHTNEPIHYVGNPGEPAFQNSWTSGAGANQPLGFWKGHEGMVHIVGSIAKASPPAVLETIMTLPDEYCPIDVPAGQATTSTFTYLDGAAINVAAIGVDLNCNLVWFGAVTTNVGSVPLTGLSYKATPLK